MENILTFKCIIGTKIGETNKKKFDVLSKNLKEKYHIVGASADFANMLFRGTTESIIINPQQIIISIENSDVTLQQIEEIQKSINIVFDILLLDDNVVVSYDFVVNKNCENNVMDDSRNMVSDKLKDLNGVKGCGIRLFYEYKDQLSEIRVEPLLADHKKMFIESLINCNNMTYEKIAKEALNAYNYFKEKYEELIQKLL